MKYTGIVKRNLQNKFNKYFIIGCFLILAGNAGAAPIRVIFLPLEDKVKLNEAWDLRVDIPRWFSQTVDTLPSHDSAIACVPFDSVLAAIKDNGWKQSELGQARIKNNLAGRFHANIIVTGTVLKFLVVKQGVNANGSVGNASSIPLPVADQSSALQGQGGVGIIGALQSFKAAIHLELDIYASATGSLLEHAVFNTERKDGGFSVWMPFQIDNSEMNFYYLSRTPFGSEYFHKSVVGALMKNYSAELHRKVAADFKTAPQLRGNAAAEVKEGKILECNGSEVYLNLGSADSVFAGEIVQIMRPDHVLTGDKGDTLGWVEKEAGSIKIQIVKAAHFSLGFKSSPADSCRSGWHVRVREGPK
ncbi:MAG: hypothetical protein PHC61_05810 [Chitinivibrionales bacterium]|nr:hypothetical protein [Chitinivibrionales bacterium]